MNDFSAIFELLATIVSTIVDWSINLICLGMLAISCIAPWRWHEIYYDLDLFSRDRRKWKELCFESLILTIFDSIQIPLICVGFLSPFRWVASFIVLGRLLFSACYADSSSDHFHEKRFIGYLIPFCVLIDLFCLPLGLFAMINPFGRQTVLARVIFWQEDTNWWSYDMYDDLDALINIDVDKAIIRYGLQSIVDIGVFIISLCMVCVPSVWIGLYRGIDYLYNHYPENRPTWNSHGNRKRFYRAWNEWFLDMRELFFNKFLNALVDIGVFPFLILAGVVPFRNNQLMQVFRKHNPAPPPEAPSLSTTEQTDVATITAPAPADIIQAITPTEPAYDLVEIPDENGVTSIVQVPRAQQANPAITRTPQPITHNLTRILTAPTVNVGAFRYEYNYPLRQEIVYLGCLALSDLLLMVMLLPLYVTQYRYRVIQKDLQANEGMWGHQQLYLIASQFCFLLVDAFVFPFAVLLFVSQIRWEPVQIKLYSENILRENNSELYGTVFHQVAMLFLDILFAPGLFFVLCSVYRTPEMLPILRHKEVRVYNCFVHKYILINILIMLHDFILLIPAMLLLAVLAPHRIPVVYDCLFNQPYSSNVITTATTTTSTTVHQTAASATTDALPTTVTTTPPAPTAQQIRRDRSSAYTHDMKNREDCWEQFTEGLFDIPYYFMALIVFITLWRASELVYRLRKIEPYYYYYFNRQNPTQYTYVRLIREAPSAVRHAVGTQFCSLLIDFVCLVPLTLIIATFYRIPELYNSFRNALRAEPLKDIPLLEVRSVSIVYPTGGEPKIKLLLKGDLPVIEEAGVMKSFQLQVLGKSLWENTSRIFGGLLTGLAKSYLPLSMEKDVSLGWKTVEIVQEAKMVHDLNTSQDISNPLTGTNIDEITVITDENDPEIQRVIEQSLKPSNLQAEVRKTSNGTELWLNLPLKGVKKTTVIKKLKKFDSTTPMIWQLECNYAEHGSPARNVVVFRLAISIKDVTSALEDEEKPVKIDSSITTANAIQLMGEASHFVNEFHMLVLKVFLEILMDMAHFILYFATLASPYRFYKLTKCMLEPNGKTNLRLLEKILYTFNQAEIHLRNYRSALIPSLNNACKVEYGELVKSQEKAEPVSRYHYYPFHSLYYDKNMEQIERAQSVYDHGRYKSLLQSAKRDIALLNLDGNSADDFPTYIQSIMELHDSLMWKWFLKYSCWLYFGHESFTRKDMELTSLVFTDEHDLDAKEIIVLNKKILQVIEAERTKLIQKKSKVPGFVKRSADQNRSLIRAYFRGLITDYVGFFMILFLMVTVIRCWPFVRDVYANSYYVKTPMNLRSVVTKHCRLLRNDLYYTALAIAYCGILLITVVGIPAFLSDVVNYLHSIEAVAQCAKKHAGRFFDNLCRLLALITVFCTYRIVLKSALYCILLPGAFVGDCIAGSVGEEFKFVVGSLIYFGILVACIVVTVQVQNDGENHSNADTANDAILGISAAICIVLVILGAMKSRSSGTTSSEEQAEHVSDIKRFQLSWSHVVGLCVGPLECLQLSAVIMYFFWNPITAKDGSSIHTVLHSTNIQLGSDTLSSILFWNSEDTTSTATYKTSSTIVIAFVFAWAILVALPIAQGGNEASGRRQQKMLEVRNAPLYDTMYMFLCHTVSVWIVAMLMRSWSCYDDINGEAILSTATSTSCGGNGFWSGTIAFPFFSFYAITSALAYSDSGTTMATDTYSSTTKIETFGYVRFGLYYTLLMKVCQYFICAACIGAFSTAPAYPVLFPIILVLAVATFLPWILPGCGSKERICNVPAILPFRSAGYASATWTAIVCLIRSFASSPSDMSNTGIFQSEGVIYVGWGIIFVAAMIHAYGIEQRMNEEWQVTLIAEGLQDAIDQLLTIYDTALIEKDNRKNFFVKSDLFMTDYKYKIQHCRSAHDVAMLVLYLEDLIAVDKLSDEFLSQRDVWITSLENVYSTDTSSTPELEALTISNAVDVEAGRTLTPGHRKPFQAVLSHITMLGTGFRAQQATTSLSRDVVTILLSNQLPRDVIWYIFEFLLNIRDLRKILTTIEKYEQENQSNYLDRQRRLQYSYNTQPLKLMKEKSKTYAIENLSHASRFLNEKKTAITQVIDAERNKNTKKK